jgi:hypothetical protein
MRGRGLAARLTKASSGLPSSTGTYAGNIRQCFADVGRANARRGFEARRLRADGRPQLAEWSGDGLLLVAGLGGLVRMVTVSESVLRMPLRSPEASVGAPPDVEEVSVSAHDLPGGLRGH